MDPLTGKLLLAAAQGAGKELVQFVGPLVGLVSVQKKVLDEIQQDVKALVAGPFEAAQEYARDALSAVSNETQEKYLMRADEQFVEQPRSKQTCSRSRTRGRDRRSSRFI
jgi:hypothetical protein